MKVLILFISVVIFGLPAAASERWKFSTSEDEMTGEKSHFAISPNATPTKPLAFPYKGVESWIGVGCKGRDYWIYFGFSSEPNLTGTETEDGYNTLETRLKVDEKLNYVRLSKTWGSNFLYVKNPRWTVGSQPGSRTGNKLIRRGELINSLRKANKVLLELGWYGNGDVYFPYSMAGSAAALAQLNSECK